MRIKEEIKYKLGYIRCKRNHIIIKLGSQIYIGKGVKVLGGDKISIGSKACIRPGVNLWCSGNKISIGSGSEIGERCRISIANELIIGEKVLISPNVYISDCDHAYADIHVPVIDQGIVKRDIHISIGDSSYIGINTVIIGNIDIGKHCVIGANSVVTRSIPNYCVAAGNPARIVRQFNHTSEKWERVKNENIDAC